MDEPEEYPISGMIAKLAEMSFANRRRYVNPGHEEVADAQPNAVIARIGENHLPPWLL